MPAGRIFIYSDQNDGCRAKITRTREIGGDGAPTSEPSRKILSHELFVLKVGDVERSLLKALFAKRIAGQSGWYCIAPADAVALCEAAATAIAGGKVLACLKYQAPEPVAVGADPAPVEADVAPEEPEPDVQAVAVVARPAPEVSRVALSAAPERHARAASPLTDDEIHFIGFLLETRFAAIGNKIILHAINVVFSAFIILFVAKVSVEAWQRISPDHSSVKFLVGFNLIMAGLFVFAIVRELRAVAALWREPIEMQGLWHFKWQTLCGRFGAKQGKVYAIALYRSLGRARRRALMAHFVPSVPQVPAAQIAAQCIRMPGQRSAAGRVRDARAHVGLRALRTLQGYGGDQLRAVKGVK